MNHNQSLFGQFYLVECFECFETWHVETGTSTTGTQISRCPYCGSINTKRYQDV